MQGTKNGQIRNFCLESPRDLILVSIPRFWDMESYLGPLSDPSDLPKWPKLGTVNFSLESPRDLTLVSICRFVAMGNHLGPFLNNSV